MTMDYGIGFTWDDNLTHNKLLAAAEEAQAIARAAEEAAEKARLASEEAEKAADLARDLAEQAKNTADSLADEIAEALRIAKEADEQANNAATAAETARVTADGAQDAADAAQSAADAALTTANNATNAAQAAKDTADAAAAAAAQNATDIVAVDNALDTHIADKAAGVHGSATAATANTIAMRGTGGTLNVGTPTAAAHAATKAYVDAADSAVLAVANAAAGAAESAALTAVWANITDKPPTYPPSAHKITHAIGGGDAIAPEDIGAAAISHTTPVATASATGHVKPGTGMSVDAAGALSVLYGTAAGTACQGNDSRLANARTPTEHASTHNTDGSDAITSLNASVITSGTIDIARLPAGALERLKIVATDAARYALTTADVQTGDTVQVTDTKIMYRVVDDSKLSTAAGYVEYTAARASAVPWSGVECKPSCFAPATHAATHKTGGGDALAPADIGAAAISHTTPVATASAAGHVKPGTGMSVDAAGALAVKYGTAAGTACQGNDSRLTDARTPAAHAATHKTGGGDALAPADIGAAAISHTTPVATASAAGHVKPGTGMSVDAAGALAVKYGTAAGTACQGNDSRLTDARTPAAHAATHKTGGGDALAPADIGAAAISHTTPVATASAAGHVKPGTGMSVDAAGALAVKYGTAAGTACQGNDSRLTNARTPTAHAATHKTGGGDALAPADIGAAPASHTTPVATASAAGHVKPGTGMSVDAAGALAVKYGTAAGTACQGNDSRLTNARTPTAHAATHKTGGTDALAPADIGAAPANATLTDAAASNTLPATTSSTLAALLQTTRNCLKSLVNDKLNLAGGTLTGNLGMNSSSLIQFDNSITNPKINLYSTSYAIGVQSATLYFRSSTYFRFHVGGVHQEPAGPGTNGTEILTLNSGSAVFNGSITATSETLSGSLTVKNTAGTSQSLASATVVEAPTFNAKNSLATGLLQPVVRLQATRSDGTPQSANTYIQALCDLVSNPVAETALDSSLLIRAGGTLYCGSGESAHTVRRSVSDTSEIPAGLAEIIPEKIYDDSEYAFFSSDQSLFLISAANTIANAKGVMLSTGGHFIPCKKDAQDLGTNTFKWRNVYGATFQGNALTAAKWQTPRTLSLTGAVTGSASVDGSGNVSIVTTAGSGMAATPKAASGVGQWRTVEVSTTGSMKEAALPSGGTWAYIILSGNMTYYENSFAGVAAGGTKVTDASYYPADGGQIPAKIVCWRIS